MRRRVEKDVRTPFAWGAAAERLVPDAVFLAGTASLGWGLWQVWPPAAWICTGALLCAVSLAGKLRRRGPSDTGN